MPGTGSDFVTAPELSPLFGQSRWPRKAAEAPARRTGTDEIWEFGAGSRRAGAAGARALGRRASRATRIVDLFAGSLRERQQANGWRPMAHKVQWVRELPETMQGVVVGNEVLDAMPVNLLARRRTLARARRGALAEGRWLRLRRPARPRCARRSRWKGARLPHRDPSPGQGLCRHPGGPAGDRRCLPARLRLPGVRVLPPAAPHGHRDVPPRPPGGRQPAGRCAAPRTSPRTSTSPASRLAAQEAGLQVLGYTSQGRFLINCGLPRPVRPGQRGTARAGGRLRARARDGRAVQGDRPGAGEPWEPIGFAAGDRSHPCSAPRAHQGGCKPRTARSSFFRRRWPHGCGVAQLHHVRLACHFRA